MKRTVMQLLTFLLTIVVSIGCFAACMQGGVTKAKLEDSTTAEQIVVSIEATDGKATAFDALKSLRNQDLVSFDYTVSTYGSYITSINGKAEQVTISTANSSEGYSWMLYTSDSEYAYESSTITVEGKTCGQASMGASSVIVKQGEIYVWVYEHYSYTW
jgi:hypothetical protein